MTGLGNTFLAWLTLLFIIWAVYFKTNQNVPPNKILRLIAAMSGIDQQTQTPGDGVTVALRTQLKNATRNIKNRWSSSGADSAQIGLGGSEEAQGLLSRAAEAPHDTPTHNCPPPPYPPPGLAIPPTAQLQRAINHTLRSESNMLSNPQPDPLLISAKDRAETICWVVSFSICEERRGCVECSRNCSEDTSSKFKTETCIKMTIYLILVECSYS